MNEFTANTEVTALQKEDIIKPKVSKNKAITYIFSGVFLSLCYSLCFTGKNIMPYMSMPIFTVIMISVIIITSLKTGLKIPASSYIWAGAALLISISNGIFSNNIFLYSNVIFIHIFTAVFILSVTRNLSNWHDIYFLQDLSKTIFIKPSMSLAVFNSINKNKLKGKSILLRIIIGIALSIPLIFIIIPLLMNADYVYQKMFNVLVENFLEKTTSVFGHIITMIIATFYFSGYILNAQNIKKSDKIFVNKYKVDSVVCITILTVLNCIFLSFCIVQFAFLFNGGIFKLPQEFTYAEYARKGFFELLFITLINFSVVLIMIFFLNKSEHKKTIKSLLTLLSIFTAVLITSSFYRMYLYIDAYGFTWLRTTVLLFLIMESFLIIMTLIFLFKNKFNLAKAYIITGIIFYITANFICTETFVTKLNIDRYFRTDEINESYILYDTTIDSAGLLFNFRKIINSNQDKNSLSIKNAIDQYFLKSDMDKFKYWQNKTLLYYLNKNFKN